MAYVMSLYISESYDGTYRYGPKLLKAGSHQFYFSFTDEYYGMVRLPAEGSYSGPEIASGSIYVYDNIGGAAIILDDSNSGYTTPSTLSPVDIGKHKVAVLQSGYFPFPPFAIIEVVQEQTVEAPFILLPCPAMITLVDEPDHLHLLRNFRDKLLNQTSSGREYVDLYYTHASEISLLIVNDSDMRIRMEKILQQFIPLLKLLMEGERIILSSEMREEIELLLDGFEAKGSSSLKAAMKKVRVGLNKGKMLKDTGFEIEDASFQIEE